MYIRKEDEVYMVDRDNAVFLIPKVKFFLRQNLEQHLKDTLVDGVSEVVWLLFMEPPAHLVTRQTIKDRNGV